MTVTTTERVSVGVRPLSQAASPSRADPSLSDDQNDSVKTADATRGVVELVTSMVSQLPILSSARRVLLFGDDADLRAHMVTGFSSTVRSPHDADDDDDVDAAGVKHGVYWVADEADLDELRAEDFDAVFVFNVHQYRGVMDRALAAKLRRVVRGRHGVLAGCGLFSQDDGMTWLERALAGAGLAVRQTTDLSLYGEVCVSHGESLDCKEHEIDEATEFAAMFVALPCEQQPQHRRQEQRQRQRQRQRRRQQQEYEQQQQKQQQQEYHEVNADDVSTDDDAVVVTGISLGLPNGEREDCSVFDQRNMDRVFSGENCISELTPQDKQRILDQNVVQVLRVDGKRVRRPLTKPSEVIQLAAKLGPFDLAKEYGVPAHVVDVLDTTYQLAIAAGLEALCSAGIPVLPQRSSGDENDDSNHDGGNATSFELPKEMQDETGVIFASSFPCLDSMVQEVSRSVEDRVIRELTAKLSSSSPTMTDESSSQAHGPDEQQDEDARYEYNRKLLFKLLLMANTQLAELVKSRGPNMHINTACSSTSQGIAMAEDWIRSGRCRRVIVIGADNATSENLLPYIGTGFLALTAATTHAPVSEAAVPFDKRRSGMILGMGAVGLVVESARSSRLRGARPMCELLGSHFLNSAFHGALLDRVHIARELGVFIDRIEQRYGVSREAIAEQCLYFSHETFTCAKGGCAQAEMDALEAAFGPGAKSRILVSNTKGMTAHPMGVGVEDVVAVAALDRGLVPPVPNYKVRDDALGDILLSRGGEHDRTYALRFAAGFGSHFVFLLMRKWTAYTHDLVVAEQRAVGLESPPLSVEYDDAVVPETVTEYLWPITAKHKGKTHKSVASFDDGDTDCHVPRRRRRGANGGDDGDMLAKRQSRYAGISAAEEAYYMELFGHVPPTMVPKLAEDDEPSGNSNSNSVALSSPLQMQDDDADSNDDENDTLSNSVQFVRAPVPPPSSVSVMMMPRTDSPQDVGDACVIM